MALLLGLLGLAGCFIPVLPGPPVSYAALLLASFTRYAHFSWRFMALWLAVAVAVTAADAFLPALFTRRAGGSRAAAVGCTAGVAAGFFIMPPWGIIICSLLGALIGEWWASGQLTGKAFRVAAGAVAAFAAGTAAKLTASAVMFYYLLRCMF